MDETDAQSSPAENLSDAWFADLAAEEAGPEPEAPPKKADKPEEPAAAPEEDEEAVEASAEEETEEPESDEEEPTEEGEEESEFVDLTDETEIFTVQQGDKEVPVTLAEARNGYLRQSDYTRKTEAVAEQRRQVEAHRQFVESELGGALGRLQNVIPALEARVNSSTASQELQRLLDEGDTAGYIQRKEAMEAERAQLEAVRAEEARVLEAQRQARIPGERAKLMERIPEWTDPAKLAEDWPKLMQFAGDVLQITPEEWRDVGYDHRFVTALEYARRYHDQARRSSVVQKRLRKLPKVARPSAPRSTEGKQEQAQKAAFQRLKKRGGISDLADTFLADGTV